MRGGTSGGASGGRRHPLLVVGRNILESGGLRTVLHKVLANVGGAERAARAGGAWCAQRAVPADLFEAVDPALWSEASAFAAGLEEQAAAKLAALGFDVAGTGSYCALLYFLARSLRPRTVLETGVAAGYSSSAILTALEENGDGHLYSSDFPYLRLLDPKRHIGCLVAPDHRRRWSLAIEGDRKNVPRLLAGAGEIDLFHYDSDKSYAGRRWVFARVTPRLAPRAVVVVDDVQDDLFFRDWVEADRMPYRVLAFRAKYVGVASRRFEETPWADRLPAAGRPPMDLTQT